MKHSMIIILLNLALGSSAFSQHSEVKLIASCVKPAGQCEIIYGPQGSYRKCDHGLDLKIYKEGTTFLGTVQIRDVDTKTTYQENVPAFDLKVRRDDPRFAHIQFNHQGVLINPGHANLKNRILSHQVKITAGLTENAASDFRHSGGINVTIGCAVGTPPHECIGYGPQYGVSLDNASSKQYFYMGATGAHCEILNLNELGIN